MNDLITKKVNSYLDEILSGALEEHLGFEPSEKDLKKTVIKPAREAYDIYDVTFGGKHIGHIKITVTGPVVSVGFISGYIDF